MSGILHPNNSIVSIWLIARQIPYYRPLSLSCGPSYLLRRHLVNHDNLRGWSPDVSNST